MHREWIVDEATVQQRQAEPDPPPDPDPDAPPHVYTTVAREMAKLGAPWLNVLKVRTKATQTLVPDPDLESGPENGLQMPGTTMRLAKSRPPPTSLPAKVVAVMSS